MKRLTVVTGDHFPRADSLNLRLREKTGEERISVNKGSLEQHTAYLEAQCADAHVHPLIGCFDDRPFAYFEIYWAKEDRIAPFYDAHDFDRGLHLLVGECGAHSTGKLNAWFNAVLHDMFIDDPRTQRIVGEPRIDNARNIAYMHRLGRYTLKEFDFPRKRAALIVLEPRPVKARGHGSLLVDDE